MTVGLRVEVTETGHAGTGDEVAAHVAGSTGGFTLVLCSLKAHLEQGIDLGAVADGGPDSVTAPAPRAAPLRPEPGG